MKKLIFTCVLTIATAFCSYAEASFLCLFNDSDLTCEISSAYDISGHYDIPSTIEHDGKEYRIISIGSGCFTQCKEMTSVTIPEGITHIGSRAFRECPEIFYNATNATCESGAFDNIKKIIIGEHVQNAPQKFAFQFEIYPTPSFTMEFTQGVESIYIPKHYGKTKIILHLNDIDEWARNTPTGYQPYSLDMSSATWDDYISGHLGETAYTATYPVLELKPVEVIADYNGRQLKNITLGSRVDKIASSAFAGINDIQSVTFPEYLSEIGEGAFLGTSLSMVQIPESVNNIGSFAFAGCKNLGEVEMPKNVTTLGEGVFANCTALYNIQLPENITEIPNHTFYECTDLEKIELTDGITRIGDNAFQGCEKLKIPNMMPDGIQEIGEYAFFKVLFPSGLKLGKNIKAISKGAFMFAKVQQSVNLPNGIETIGDCAFLKCTLKEINLPESLTEIGSSAFRMSNISSVTIPKSITSINSLTFAHTPLTSVTLSANLRSIDDGAFYNTELTGIALNEGLEEIGSEAFSGTSLTNCIVPHTVLSIGANAFDWVNYLTLGSGITSIPEKISEYGVEVLEMMSSNPPVLDSDRLGFTPRIVIVPEGADEKYTGNNRWKDYNIAARNGRRASVYITEPGTLATECRIQTGYLPAQITNLIVEGTLNDDDFAVMRSNMTSCYTIDLSKLKNISLPSGALKEKGILLQLTLPEKLEEIGASAFEGCNVMHLTSLPSYLKKIGAKAFYNCSSMDNDLIFPSTLNNIGEQAFWGCYGLKGVDFSACPDATFGSYTFYYNKNLTNAILPAGLKNIPRDAFAMSALREVTIPEGITEIEEEAFYRTSQLKNVVFPQSLKSIGQKAFESSAIEAADLPSTLEIIDIDAFTGSSIVYADIKEGITVLPEGVFARCPMLFAVNLPSTLKYLGANAISSSSIAAITSASELPAATTEGSPFTDVDNYTCALTIPKPSYSKYLSAEYWGAFVDIRNWIDVTMPETSIEVTYIDENDYQEMLEDEADESDIPSSARRRALGVMRRDGKISTSRGYGKLFNGASLFVADKSQTRIFINVPESFTDLKVVYNGTDITSQIDPETMSFVTPELTAVSSLKISGYDPESKISDITANDDSAPVYTLTGTIAAHGKQSLSQLPGGIYIFCGQKLVVK